MAVTGERSRPSGSKDRVVFIVSSNNEKVNPATRKLIRSHVMQGKKQKRGQRSGHPGTSEKCNSDCCTLAKQVPLDEAIETHAALLPGRVGSDLSFIDFAAELEPSMAINMIKFSPIAMKIMYPLLMAIGFRADHKEPMYPVFVDAAVLHVTAFAVDGFIQRILRRQGNVLNPAAMLHYQKGVQTLRQRLLDEDEVVMLADSTITAIVKLADTAHFDGEYEVSRQHMEGLRKIVDLRGGPDVFRGTKLLVEILRCDLKIALLNCTNPIFYFRTSEPMPEYPEELLPAASDKKLGLPDAELISTLDRDLAVVWWVMRRFCLQVNLGTQTQRLIYPDVIHGTAFSVIYRLLGMRFAKGSVDEVVRLGLLAFGHHVFLQWQDIKLPYYSFITVYHNCVETFDLDNGAFRQLKLWLLMVGANSLFTVFDEAWLYDALWEQAQRCQVTSWKGMQEILRSFMWISLLDDEPGKQVYELFRGRDQEGAKDIDV